MTVSVDEQVRREAYGAAIVADADEVAWWRNRVAAVAIALGADDTATDVVRLGVSELLSNVVRHVDDRRCLLDLRREGPFMTVRLFDRSRAVPAVRAPDWTAESGRGLWLLREMTAGVGYTLTREGKWLWFRCRATTAEPPA